MRIVADASSLVPTILRVKGRQLLVHPALELAIATETWNETTYELEKRLGILIARGHMTLEEARVTLRDIEGLIPRRLLIVPDTTYRDRLPDALWRIPRDPKDAPTVALALSLGCGIWSADHDFFGCGLPVWTTQTLERILDEQVSQGDRLVSP